MLNDEASQVVTKTTKPKVIIQTKKLHENLEDFSSLSGKKAGRVGSLVFKVVVLLLLLANAVFSFLSYVTTREEFRFTVLSNGGLENYQMLKTLYASPAFQQANTLSIYQLMERVEQTLTATQVSSDTTDPSVAN